MKYLILLVLLLCIQGCTLLSMFNGWSGKDRPCSKETIAQAIRAAQKAGCKRYTIEKDHDLETCAFHCYETR